MFHLKAKTIVMSNLCPLHRVGYAFGMSHTNNWRQN